MSSHVFLASLALSALSAQTASAGIVSFDAGGTLSFMTDDSPFDPSLQVGATYFNSYGGFDVSSFALTSSEEATDVFRKTWHFAADGRLTNQAGSYFIDAPLSEVSVVVAKYEWFPADTYEVGIYLQSFIAPLNPASPSSYGANIPFSIAGSPFQDISEYGPNHFFSGSAAFWTRLNIADASSINDGWVESSLWSDIASGSFAGSQSFYAGTFGLDPDAFGYATSWMDDVNIGYLNYQYFPSGDENAVPDASSTWSLALAGLGGLLAGRRVARYAGRKE